MRSEVDLHAVLGSTGLALVVLGLAQLVPAGVALVTGAPCLALALAALAVSALGGVLASLRRLARKVTRREALASVVLAWLASIAAAALPYLVTGVADPLDALFESTSGLTTTGASIFADVDGLRTSTDLARSEPVPLLALHVWRCLTHWIGGAGIVLVVFVLTPFVRDEEGLRRTQRSEASILTVRYRGSTRATLRGLLVVYVGLTAAQTLAMVALGVDPLDALLHAFGTVATGGFSTHTASLNSWGPAVQLVTVGFMALGAMNFAVMGRAVEEARQAYRVRRATRGPVVSSLLATALLPPGLFRNLWRNVETRAYLLLLSAAAAALSALLFTWGAPRYAGRDGALLAAQDGVFNATTISTTTGFGSEDFAGWPSLAQAILFGLMLIGGCSGSTAGGLKVRRILIAALCALRELRRAVHPRGVFLVKLGGERIDDDQAREALTYVFAYLALLLLVALSLSATGVDLVTAAGTTASCFASTGPGLGAAGPASNYQVFTPAGKALLMGAMLLGRLEIYPLVSALTPSFWLRRRRPPGR